MKTVHIGDVTVSSLLDLKAPIAIVYHKRKIPIGYILPVTPEVQEYIDQTFGRDGTCTAQSTLDTDGQRSAEKPGPR